MKKFLIIITAIISLLPFNAKAEQLSADCSKADSTRRCVLDSIDATNRTNKATSGYQHWIGLQIGIPIPDGLCQEPEYLCYQGQLVGVKNAGGLLAAFFQFAIIMISITLSVVMVIGGVMYITSGGDAGRASKGRDFIRNASFSLVVLMFSVMILYQINPKLLSVNIAADVVSKVEAQISCNDSDSYACGSEYVSPYMKPGIESKCTGTKATSGKYCGQCDGANDDAECQEPKVFENAGKLLLLSKKQIDKSCKSNQECVTGLCLAGSCKAIPQNIGGSCELNTDCAGLVCETNDDNSCSLGRSGADCDPGLISAFAPPNECDDLHACFDGPGLRNFCIPKTGMLFQLCNKDDQCGRGMKCAGVCVTEGLSAFCTTDAECQKMTYTKDSTPKCITAINLCGSKEVGSICKNNSDCNSNRCYQIVTTDTGVCTLGEKGDYCVEGSDCQSNRCDTSKTGGIRGICS